MKRLFLSAIFAAAAFTSNAQEYNYTMLNEYENHILDRYKIDYTGPHVRYMIESGEVDNLDDNATKNAMQVAYDNFIKFNKNYFQTVPTSSSFILFTGTQYIENKDCDNFTKLICGDSRLIVGFYKKVVNDLENDIRSIEIIEINDAGTQNINHAIFIEDFNGFSTLITPEDFHGMVLCGQCPIE